jgi:hypothetical protein
MHPVAHHAGEDSLISLLVFGGSWLAVAAAIGRTQLAAALARLAGRDGPRRRGRDAGQGADQTPQAAAR